jgi:hypothetical protein
MTAPPPPNAAGLLLTDAEVEEFRRLARDNAGAELTTDDARKVIAQLLGVLSIIRAIALRGSSDSTSPVDGRPLPESANRAITTASPT